VIKRSDHKCSTFVFGGVVEVAALASLRVRVCYSCGNKWGTCGSKSSTRCRCCGTEWSCGIVIVEILHSGEDGRASVLEHRNKSLVFAIAYLSLTCIYISCMLLLLTFLYAWYSCAQLNICLGIFAHTCISQERHSDTSTLNLEESWGDSLEPFVENSATLFSYTWCV